MNRVEFNGLCRWADRHWKDGWSPEEEDALYEELARYTSVSVGRVLEVMWRKDHAAGWRPKTSSVAKWCSELAQVEETRMLPCPHIAESHTAGWPVPPPPEWLADLAARRGIETLSAVRGVLYCLVCGSTRPCPGCPECETV